MKQSVKMKSVFYIVLFIVFLSTAGGCISEQDLYGNWYSPQDYGDRREIVTPDYAVTFCAPEKYSPKSDVIKASYHVRNYYLFLRVENTSGLIDNVYNIFGFTLRDHTRYWLGFIPIFGFQYSYKIPDEEMLLFLQKYKFTRKQVLDDSILTDSGYVPDHSAPTLMDHLKE